MQIVFATGNLHKVREVNDIVASLMQGQEHQVELLPYSGPEPIEDGTTFLENALIKARAASAQTGMPAIADDSGLAIEIMGGSPGIFSARWSGSRDDEQNRQLVLAQLADVKREHRAAAFVCTIALVDGENEVSFTGIWPGRIAHEATGEHGFGYDPIFIPEGFEISAAELEPELKNQLSHRSLALEQLASYLAAQLSD